ncbi:MAG: DUF1800 domain-containing protein, partial [Pseudomonadota bacterium]
MAADPSILNLRFGLGFGPGLPAARRAEELLEPLAGPDRIAERFPIARYADLAPVARRFRELRRARRDALETERRAIEDELDAMRERERTRQAESVAAAMARAAETRDPLRERLTYFWADHFTTRGLGPIRRAGVPTYTEETIRPFVSGSFADLLKSAILHPQMLFYLDQSASVGPNSQLGLQRGQGLNENLARELLELHTLGVDGPYDQRDVRQLAELLAGLRADAVGSVTFDQRRGEPGPETVLGQDYGQRVPDLADVERVLDDLARHPATAMHIARKLAVHFVSDTPGPDLVEHVATRFRETDGALAEVYSALLEHSGAHGPDLEKIKQPWGLLATSFRAMGVPGSYLTGLRRRRVNSWILRPMADMGQRWMSPSGPDGWPEAAEDWIAPQVLAARITWAMGLPRMGFEMPEPRGFVDTALGPFASEATRFAAR